MSHISDKFLFLEFVVLILLNLFHIFFVEYRFVALSQVLNRYFTIGLISVSYLKDIYFVIYGIISDFTDKRQLQYLTNLKGPQEGTYLYTTLFLSLR